MANLKAVRPDELLDSDSVFGLVDLAPRPGPSAWDPGFPAIPGTSAWRGPARPRMRLWARDAALAKPRHGCRLHQRRKRRPRRQAAGTGRRGFLTMDTALHVHGDLLHHTPWLVVRFLGPTSTITFPARFDGLRLQCGPRSTSVLGCLTHRPVVHVNLEAHRRPAQKNNHFERKGGTRCACISNRAVWSIVVTSVLSESGCRRCRQRRLW